MQLSVITVKVASALVLNARIPGSNPTADGYFLTSSLKALCKSRRLLKRYKNAGCRNSAETFLDAKFSFFSNAV